MCEGQQAWAYLCRPAHALANHKSCKHCCITKCVRLCDPQGKAPTRVWHQSQTALCLFELGILHTLYILYTLYTLYTLDIIHTREKGKLPPAKGKRKKAKRMKGKGRQPLLRSNSTRQPDRAYARTNETKRFPGWARTHPPTSDIYIYTYLNKKCVLVGSVSKWKYLRVDAGMSLSFFVKSWVFDVW